MSDATAQPQDPKPIQVDGAAPAVAAPAPSGAIVTEATLGRESMLNVMRDKYKTEKRVRVKVHNDGPVQVQVNGYSFLIRENVPVEVPESVAEILDQAGYI
jgi:hypothetical protein